MLDKDTFSEKEKRLKENIARERRRYAKLKQKRQLELGQLLIKTKLDELDTQTLETELTKLAKKLVKDT